MSYYAFMVFYGVTQIMFCDVTQIVFCGVTQIVFYGVAFYCVLRCDFLLDFEGEDAYNINTSRPAKVPFGSIVRTAAPDPADRRQYRGIFLTIHMM